MDRGFLSSIELKTPKGRIYYGVTVFILTILALIVLFPFVYAFTSGLKGSLEVFNSGLNLIPQKAQWHNYRDAWEDFKMLKLFRNSFIIVTVSVLLRLSVSVMAAYSLSQLKPFGRQLVMLAFLLTLMIPSIAYLVPLFVTLGNLPIVHKSILDSYWGLWIPYAADAFGIFVLKSFFDRIPPDITDSAKIDGASSFQTLVYIVLPLSRSIIIILGILSFMNIWKDYLLPLLVISDPERQPITVRLFYVAKDYGVNLQMAAAFMALLPPLLIAILMQRYLKAGLTMGSIKG
ncbi:MAG: carbohydrate ABC transporter permease [Anaerolineae bacterium]|nr:MAG: carbohydrate ABC transporter permease [Anaerolineae bacterium]